jgi:hypothetical protein
LIQYHKNYLRGPPPFPDVKNKIFSIFFFSLINILWSVLYRSAKKIFSFTMFWSRKTGFSRSPITKNSIFFFIDKYTLKCPLSICEKKKYLAKNRNSILFCGFLKTIFWPKKVQNRPRFSAPVHPIELKIFLQILETIWGVYFFLFWKILYYRYLADVTKKFVAEKHALLRVLSVFWLFFWNGTR